VGAEAELKHQPKLRDRADGEACAAAVAYMLDDPVRAKAMGEAGRRWVDRAWRWSTLAAPLLKELT